MKCKANRKGTSFWSTIKNQKVYINITVSVKHTIYYITIQHPQVAYLTHVCTNNF